MIPVCYSGIFHTVLDKKQVPIVRIKNTAVIHITGFLQFPERFHVARFRILTIYENKEQHMRHSSAKFVIVPLLITFFIMSALTPVAQAKIIDTQTLIAAQSNSPKIQLQDLLSREDVRDKLIELGVNPNDAGNRIAALTDQEISQLQLNFNDLPAGSSALAVLGAVFLVLLVLELVGVTNVFSKL